LSICSDLICCNAMFQTCSGSRMSLGSSWGSSVHSSRRRQVRRRDITLELLWFAVCSAHCSRHNKQLLRMFYLSRGCFGASSAKSLLQAFCPWPLASQHKPTPGPADLLKLCF
jgi:hypothetical protein